MLAGDIDAFPRFGNFDSVAQFQSDPRFKVTTGGTEGKTILAINNKKKPLDDVRVRRAIAYAIDRKAIIDGAMNGFGTPIGSHLTPTDPGYVDLTGEYPHDPAKAKALLKEAGVATPLQLSLILPPPTYARKGGEIIAAELAEVGIQAKIENVEWAQWLSGVYTGKNYDLTIISHVEPLDIGIYANPNYYFQYDNQDFRDIIAKLSAAPDLDTLQEIHGRGAAQAGRRLRQRLPVPTPAGHHRRRRICTACGRTRRSSPTTFRPCPGNSRGSAGSTRRAPFDRARRARDRIAAVRREDVVTAAKLGFAQTLEIMRPYKLSATELLLAYRTRRLSPLEAMKDVLERVSAVRAAYPRNLSPQRRTRARRGASVGGSLDARGAARRA